jgi:hypothetical protein
VVNSLPVESGKAQIASVAFGTLAKVNFYFNTYKNKTAIVDNIINTDKGELFTRCFISFSLFISKNDNA